MSQWDYIKLEIKRYFLAKRKKEIKDILYEEVRKHLLNEGHNLKLFNMQIIDEEIDKQFLRIIQGLSYYVIITTGSSTSSDNIKEGSNQEEKEEDTQNSNDSEDESEEFHQEKEKKEKKQKEKKKKKRKGKGKKKNKNKKRNPQTKLKKKETQPKKKKGQKAP
ncbi:nucleic acid-binding protein [Anaeramoeba flamelloides]|uniref:Nucleic acid-binding protein n=1 Tax=Anaeramoeba flamelloides TaxID=1746091 RepID=A0AAV7Y3E2_9EUKA|nr:nucleic acid-binding protein [Anaeramoeba flamelloides]